MSFEAFLKEFVPLVARKSREFNKAVWLLAITGLPDAADLQADLDAECRCLFNDKETYQKLLQWEKTETNPLLKRQVNVLIRAFKQNQVPKELLESLAKKEADLGQAYSAFRPKLDGKAITENDIREALKNEDNPGKRQKVWEASKEVGDLMAPQILELVALRNEAARSLGYPDYFQMQLELQEVDAKWLLQTLDELSKASADAYEKMLAEINQTLEKRFDTKEVGPWGWSDPFSQEDPLDSKELDQLVANADLSQAGLEFYRNMGVDVAPILERSDMYEREGKNQHAFCIHLDREGDIRTFNNVKPAIKWFDTVLHELGHAVYELGFDQNLPWLLKEPPHMITTEAMALIAGRYAYHEDVLAPLGGSNDLRKKAAGSLKRRQLIFSRWVLVMTAFESEMYRDPKQNLNKLWWDLVEKYQKIPRPAGREKHSDWASKYHIALAPVYYFSYLLGEMFASQIQEALPTRMLNTEPAGKFLFEKLFRPGNSMPWNELIKHTTGRELSHEAWVKEFAK